MNRVCIPRRSTRGSSARSGCGWGGSWRCEATTNGHRHSNDVFARIQAGDYDGTRNINGVERKSIFREYADSLAQGLVDYYSKARNTTARSGGR